MAPHSSILAWRIPGTGEPGGLPSLGSHRVGHDWSDLAAAAAERGTQVLNAGELWFVFHSLFYRMNGASTIAGNSERYLLDVGAREMLSWVWFLWSLWFLWTVHGEIASRQTDVCMGLRRKLMGLGKIQDSSVWQWWFLRQTNGGTVQGKSVGRKDLQAFCTFWGYWSIALT